MLSFVVWCLFGGIAGLHFGVRTQRDAIREVQRNVAIGSVGGMLGGFLLHWNIAPKFLTAESVLTAFVGAIVFLAMGNWVLRPGVQ